MNFWVKVTFTAVFAAADVFRILGIGEPCQPASKVLVAGGVVLTAIGVALVWGLEGLPCGCDQSGEAETK